jgi:hypothetical protein
VEVRDNGRGAPPPDRSDGHGLIGYRSLIALIALPILLLAHIPHSLSVRRSDEPCTAEGAQAGEANRTTFCTRAVLPYCD